MRPRLKQIFCVVIAAAVAVASARADDRSIAEKWSEVEANAAIFKRSAERLGLSSSWASKAPIHLDFLPPATEDQVQRAEHSLGETLPDSLREFFLEASAGVHILWLMPGEIETLPGGLSSIRYRGLPPPPWQVDAPGGGRRVPVINGGVLSFSLDSVAGLTYRARSWKRLFQAEAETSSDPARARHYLRYAKFWERGLPLSADGGGGILAVDREDPEGGLIYMLHDGEGSPGWFLDLSPIDFMVMQSRLGFPGIGEQELTSFGTGAAVTSSMAQSYASEYEAEARQFGLSMPRSLGISDNAPGVDIWRAWLGL